MILILQQPISITLKNIFHVFRPEAIGCLLSAANHVKTCNFDVWPLLNPRPAGPSPAPALCWGGGGGGRRVAPPIYLGNHRRGGKFPTAMESPGRDLSVEVEKFDPGVTCDVTGQVKHKMFYISNFHLLPFLRKMPRINA